MVLLCYFVSTYVRSATWAGQASKQPSSIILVSWCRFFQHFDMYHTHAHHYSLQICLPVVPCERDWCAFNLIHFGCALKVHQRDSCECAFNEYRNTGSCYSCVNDLFRAYSMLSSIPAYPSHCLLLLSINYLLPLWLQALHGIIFCSQM